MTRNKYNARKTIIGGIVFDSMAEANRYIELQLLERAGEITSLELQPQFELIPTYTRVDGKRKRKRVYTADFRYVDTATGETVVEDVKGRMTTDASLRIAIAEYMHNIVVRIVK